MHEQLNEALKLSSRLQLSSNLIFATQMYQLLRRLLFLLPAETAHYLSMNVFQALCSIGFFNKILVRIFATEHTVTPTEHFGLLFKNPIGLGAGFDKNARYLNVLETLGFGFVEIGTVTPKPQPGNEKPRLFRLPKDKALINRMGFNNEGVEVVVERLKKWKIHRPSTVNRMAMLIGGNIGKNKTTPNDEAWKDYEICFDALHDYVDFFVVNVSSPNTPGLRELQEKEALQKILTRLQLLNTKKNNPKPILLKIAPDLTDSQIDDVIDLAREIKLDGLVATNTTIDRKQLITDDNTIRNIGAGGLSGRPLKKRSTEVIHYIDQKTGGNLPVIGSGGVFDGIDATEKIKAGASLIEVWTGFIYEGPFIVKKIMKHLKN